MLSLNKNIIIYPHFPLNLNDGGTTVQYYLASILNNLGINVKICNVYDNNSSNILYNNFITTTEIANMDMENIIVIYCEGIIGNPLNAKYVVRWMLSKLGQNVPYERYLSWGNNELIYFFNSEIDIIDQDLNIKYLSLLYVNPRMQNLNQERNGDCYTIRKTVVNHKEKIHSDNAFEIHRSHTQDDYINIFNRYEYFISYDPVTFLSIIAALCGCISIVCPIDGISKKDYFQMTAVYEYMKDKNLDSLYGIAYGNSSEEINFARNTKHLLNDQMRDITNWMIEKYVKSFINDLCNWENNKNTLNNYINSVQIIDYKFYKDYYQDLKHMNNDELIRHYNEYGRKEGRFISKEELEIKNEKFDYKFYGSYYTDLSHMSRRELFRHYNEYGRNEGRIVSQQELNELLQSTGRPDFDPKFYSTYYTDLNHMNFKELIRHYNEYGRNEGRVCSQQELNELLKSTGREDFDHQFYRTYYTDLNHMNIKELIRHYNEYGRNEGRIVCNK